MYIIFNGSTVSQIIPAKNPAFPDMPIERIYPPQVIASWVEFPDSTTVGVGWAYDGETFSPPVYVEPPEPEPAPEPEPDERDARLDKIEEAMNVLVEGLI